MFLLQLQQEPENILADTMHREKELEKLISDYMRGQVDLKDYAIKAKSINARFDLRRAGAKLKLGKPGKKAEF